MLKTNTTGKSLIQTIAKRLKLEVNITENEMNEGNFYIQFPKGDKNEAKMVNAIRKTISMKLTTEKIYQGSTKILDRS